MSLSHEEEVRRAALYNTVSGMVCSATLDEKGDWIFFSNRYTIMCQIEQLLDFYAWTRYKPPDSLFHKLL